MIGLDLGFDSAHKFIFGKRINKLKMAKVEDPKVEEVVSWVVKLLVNLSRGYI